MSKHVSHRKITTRNSNDDEVVIFEQNHYNEWAYTVMQVNGKEVNARN